MVLARIILATALSCLFLVAGAVFAQSSFAVDSTATGSSQSKNSRNSHHKRVSNSTASATTHEGSGRSRKHVSAAAVASTSVRGRHSSQTETKKVAVTVRDKHGRQHKVYREVAVHTSEPTVHTHNETKRVAVMVRDRHGRLHKVFKTETVQVADERSTPGRVKKTGNDNERASKDDEKAVKGTNVADNKHEENDGEPKDTAEPERLNPSFGRAYALYDEGANARISGNYSLAIANLGRALSMVPANSHGGPSVLQLNMEYELAQSAEAAGDMPLAARYYARALSDRPNFTEASVRLATVLARVSNYDEALKAARSAVQRSPNDPRTHAILAVILEKMGAAEEAAAEKMKTKSLMANIHALDTAPLAPNTPNAEQSSVTDSDSTNSNTNTNTNTNASPETDSSHGSVKPAEKRSNSSAPEPGSSGGENMNDQ